MSKVVFAGVGKTETEIIEALDAGIGYFNIESEAELENLIKLCRVHGKTTTSALRVNPDINYDSHKYITTGVKETKFGIDIERTLKIYDKYAGNDVVEMTAIHVHLGSGGKSIGPYVNYVKKVLPLVEDLRGMGYTIDKLDMGGGVLITRQRRCPLRPIMLARTVFRKSGGEKTFVIVDAGMNDLIRPCLYEAFHFIWPVEVGENFVPEERVNGLEMDNTDVVDVVGPICEGTDYFAKNRAMPPVKRGDLVAVFSVGAYGYTMASNYKARPMCAEVLVDGDQFRISANTRCMRT
jgi:diaminopimelate decarboxylase